LKLLIFYERYIMSLEKNNEPVEVETKPKLQEVDRLVLEVAKANKKTALAYAEKALAQNETAELAYKYVVIQLYMKYNLTEADAINEFGEIIKNGALLKGQQ